MRLSVGAWERGYGENARTPCPILIPSHQSWNGHFKRMRTGLQILPGTYRGNWVLPPQTVTLEHKLLTMAQRRIL